MVRQRDLFKPMVDESRLHPNYCVLRDSTVHGDARAYMNALYARMGDPNGNFLTDFQTQGFHPRVFELASFAYLESSKLGIDRSYESPDFLVFNGDNAAALEVTTTNPTVGDDADVSVRNMRELSQEELAEKVYIEFPGRVYEALRKKLGKNYQDLSQCRDKPLVLVVGSFYEPGSVFYTDEALLPSLYGVTLQGTPEVSLPPFFSLPGSEHIAAVAYCNQFTVPRFFRLAPRIDRTAAVQAYRSGFYCKDVSTTVMQLGQYEYEIDKNPYPPETWAQGVSIFFNPGAERRLDNTTLPCTSAFHAGDSGVHREIFGMHTLTSAMIITGAEAII